MSDGYKAIFWDNDGILFDTEPLYFKANKDVLATVGVELSEDLFVELLLADSRGVWHLAEEKGVPAEEVKNLRQKRNRLYSDLIRREAAVIEGVIETLQVLQGNFLMCIVTSSIREHFDQIHKRAGILHFFDFVLTREDYQKSKPDPEPYLLALERSGFEAAQCLAVEDSLRGVRAAKAAGLDCFAIPTALSRSLDFSLADKVLASVYQLPAAIKES